MTIRYINRSIRITDNSAFMGNENININVFNSNKSLIERRRGALVYLFNQKNYSIISVKSTNQYGEVSFRNLDVKNPNNLFMVLSHDYKKEFNAVIADNIGGPNYVDD